MILDNNKFRIDSDFFLKKYINSYLKVKEKPFYQLQEIISVLSDFSANGSYKTIAENFTLLDKENYAYMVRSTDFEKSDFENNVKYVDKHSYEFLEKSQLFGGELLVNKIGSPGRVYLMPHLNRPVSLGMNLFMIRLKNEIYFSEKFLWIYFKTNFGQTIIKRKVNGTVPLTIDKKAILSLYIPKFNIIFTDKIEQLIDISERDKQYSKKAYTQAETLLLQEIGLAPLLSNDTVISLEKYLQEKFNPTIDDVLKPNSSTKPDALDKINFLKEELEKINTLEKDTYYQKILEKEQLISELDTTFTSLESELNFEKKLLDLIKKHNQNVKNIKEIQEAANKNINIKSFKDSFGTSGRLDAEYYQLKYEQVVNKVKSKPYDVLSNIVDIKKSIEPGSKNYVEKGLPFMRVADLSKNGLSEPQKFISEHFVQANKDKIRDLKPKKGTILFSKDGTVGIAYHLRQDYNGITSGAILHLNVKDENRIIPEYLTLALNSKIVQMQAERDAGGSIILHWRSSEIENVVVPIIDYKKQQQIANLIEESFALKKQSKHLLEVAKKAVEIAIEEDEEVALKYIKENE